MADYKIRAADAHDVKHIADMEKMIFNRPWSEKSFFDEITANKAARYFVAETEEEIVGYAGVWLISGEGHITNVAVRPGFRRKGIGGELVTTLIKASQAEGAMDVTLEVRASDKTAISLYKRLGFKECGVRKSYYEDNGEDAVIMWKTKQA